MIDLKKMFVLVPAGTIGTGQGKTTIEAIKAVSTTNFQKIYFVEDTNEIVVKGVAYGANPTDLARIAALETSVGNLDGATDGLVQKVAALTTLLGANELASGTANVLTRISALETLVGDDAADADTVINKLKEVYDWFAQVAETETGKALIADVAANKAAIGTATVGTAGEAGYVEGTGLTKRIEALEAKNAAENFTVEDAAVEGKYVSSVSQGADGKIVVSREELPQLSVKSNSSDFVAVSKHEVEIKTVALADTVGMTKNADGTWSAGTATSQANGLTTAADVAAEIVADEEVIAAALNDHESRITGIKDDLEAWDMWTTYTVA